MCFQFVSSWFEWLRVYSDLCIPHDTASCFSFFLFIAFHLWILWAYQGSIKLYRRKLSCIDTNPLSTLLALICITFFSLILQKTQKRTTYPYEPVCYLYERVWQTRSAHEVFGRWAYHLSLAFQLGRADFTSYNRTKPVWSLCFAAT